MFGELVRSIATSMISFSVDIGILALLTEVFLVFYLVSAAISFGIGVTVSYALSVLWVFGRRRIPSKAAEYALFVLIGVIGLGLNEALLWLFTERLSIYYLLSKLIAAVLIFAWNFGARKYLLFR